MSELIDLNEAERLNSIPLSASYQNDSPRFVSWGRFSMSFSGLTRASCARSEPGNTASKLPIKVAEVCGNVCKISGTPSACFHLSEWKSPAWTRGSLAPNLVLRTWSEPPRREDWPVLSRLGGEVEEKLWTRPPFKLPRSRRITARSASIITLALPSNLRAILPALACFHRTRSCRRMP
jgi:hypothetical protein